MVHLRPLDLLLVAAFVLATAVHFGHFFFGFRRVLAAVAVVGAIVLISILPSAIAVAVLFAGFIGLILASAYRHMKNTVFATSAAALLKDSLAGTAEAMSGEFAQRRAA